MTDVTKEINEEEKVWLVRNLKRYHEVADASPDAKREADALRRLLKALEADDSKITRHQHGIILRVINKSLETFISLTIPAYEKRIGEGEDLNVYLSRAKERVEMLTKF